MTLDVQTLDHVLLVGAVVLLLAILAVRLSVGFGLPSLLIYLLIGVALGESGLGLEFDNAELAHALGFAALILILAEGGLTTPWPEIRPVMRLGVSLATVGVAVSVLVMAVFCHFVLGLSWELSVLLGAVTSPTDAAAVFSVLRRVPLPRRLTGSLEAESGLNDAPTVVLVTLVSAGSRPRAAGLRRRDRLGARRRRRRRPARRVRRRLAAAPLGAAELRSLPAGRAVLDRAGVRRDGRPPRVRVRRGLRRRADPGQRRAPAPGGHPVVLRGRRVARADRPVRDARPAAHTEPDRPGHDRDRGGGGPRPDLARAADLGARGLGGATDAACASWRSSPGRACAVPCRSCWPPSRWPSTWTAPEQLFDIVFVIVVIYTLVTAPTLPWLAKVLKVARRSEPRDLEVEAAPLERIAADLLQVTISPKSLMHGVEVGRAAAAAGVVGGADRPGRQDAGAGAAYGPATRRRRPRRDAAQGPRGDRAAAARGLRRWPAGPVARQATAELTRVGYFTVDAGLDGLRQPDLLGAPSWRGP